MPDIGFSSTPAPVIHMTAAGIGEIVACLVRVPTEVVKQRYQAKIISSDSLSQAIWQIYKSQGILKGFYTGYLSTIFREIPFSFIQFPLYEWMKVSSSLTCMISVDDSNSRRKLLEKERRELQILLKQLYVDRYQVVLLLD